ncbi:single-stranded DNA-binding protein [[Phormidium] sp. LEGE 05292]|uniref:single-stranded DNA-binding protein n=1 Tax=[Phormidium] sp. LEGE 05292 TaxID=767427 RepID=UPI001D14568D|nr:single-stranded DNA-binding protein [Phormidium sp. LEGE 05292]
MMFTKQVMTTTIDTNKLLEEATEIPAPNLTLNSVNLVGRAGTQPEVKYFESGSIKTTISMAVRRPSKNSNPDWFTIELWNKAAEIAANYLRKGDLFGISGYLKIETWIDEHNDCSRSKPVIKADKIYLLGGKHADNASDNDAF